VQKLSEHAKSALRLANDQRYSKESQLAAAHEYNAYALRDIATIKKYVYPLLLVLVVVGTVALLCMLVFIKRVFSDGCLASLRTLLT
jgi:hypothetical protein